jgi:hypothetical protein
MMRVVCAVDEVLRFEFEEYIDLAFNMLDCLKGLFLKDLQLLILHLHLFDLVELLIELVVEGMQHSGLKRECAASDC